MFSMTRMVESRCGAVALGRTYLLPPLSSGGALVVLPWLRFQIPLIGRVEGWRAGVAPGVPTQTTSPAPRTPNGSSRTIEILCQAQRGGAMTISKHMIEKNSTYLTSNEYYEVLMEAAKLEKRDNENISSAFARIVDENIEYRKGMVIARRYGESIAKRSGYPDVMSLEPVSVEAGSTEVEDDSTEAIRQLNELAEAQRARAPTMTAAQAFERVFQDPANAKLAANTYRRRPNACSVN
jgi:hypothetical protein